MVRGWKVQSAVRDVPGEYRSPSNGTAKNGFVKYIVFADLIDTAGESAGPRRPRAPGAPRPHGLRRCNVRSAARRGVRTAAPDQAYISSISSRYRVSITLRFIFSVGVISPSAIENSRASTVNRLICA